jgi:hypothetical protein
MVVEFDAAVSVYFLRNPHSTIPNGQMCAVF